ncbi:MAG: SoxR reducing system RseC family protein [Nitrospirae bacterium]|nr:SoxR reducing system RseC family protein [Nitrospirota bacterium]
MDEIGIVKSVEGIFALVSVERKSTCEQCAAGCKVTDSGAEIEAVNLVKAREGQKVRVTLKPYAYLKGSVIAYGLPALALIAGAVAGKEVFSRFFPAMDPDLVSAIFGFGAFFVSFILVKLWSMRVQKKPEYKPVIEEIIE